MDIFSLFTLFGGLAFFLYGMHVMSSGLEKMAGGKLEVLLKRMTSNPFKSLALGARHHHCDPVLVGADRHAGGAGQLGHHAAWADSRRDYGLEYWYHSDRMDSELGRH